MKSRYSLALPERISDLVDDIASRESTTKNAVIQNAVGLYLYLYEQVNEKGATFLLRTEDDQDRELVFKGVL